MEAGQRSTSIYTLAEEDALPRWRGPKAVPRASANGRRVRPVRKDDDAKNKTRKKKKRRTDKSAGMVGVG